MNENAKIDNNFKKTLLGVTDDATAEIRQLKVDNATGRLLVSAVGAGITELNGLNGSSQKFAVAATGNQFNISSAGTTHTFALPTASSTGTGQLKGDDWSAFYAKLYSLNAITTHTQTFAIGSTGNQFNISSSGSVHTFNLPTASSTGTGQLTALDWSDFDAKVDEATSDGTTYGRNNAAWVAIAGGGDVTSAASITDHSIVRGDGGVKGVQDTAILIDDLENISGIANLSTGSITNTGLISTGSISSTGTIQGGSLYTAGWVNATGTVQGGNFYTAGWLTATGTVNAGNFNTVGQLSTGSVNSTGTILAGSFSTAGWVNATGTIRGGNLYTANQVSATGTIVGGTLRSLGVLNADGTVYLAESAGFNIKEGLSGVGKFSGILSTGVTAGAVLAFGQLCYLGATNTWLSADSSGTSTSGDVKLGMCTSPAGGAGSITAMLLIGNIKASIFPSFGTGQAIYAGETSGSVVATMPITSGAVIRIVGFANSINELYFNPSNDYITHI